MKYLLALRSKASFFPALPYAFQHWKFLSRSWQSVLCYASQMWCRPKSLSTLRHAIPWLSTEPFNFGGLGVWCEAMTAVRRSQQIRAKQNHSCILSSDCPRVILSVLGPCCLRWGKVKKRVFRKVDSIWRDGSTLSWRCKTKGRSQGNGECLCSLKVCKIKDINNARVPDGTLVIMHEAMWLWYSGLSNFSEACSRAVTCPGQEPPKDCLTNPKYNQEKCVRGKELWELPPQK